MINTRCNEQNEVVKYQFFQELAECGIDDKDPVDNKTIRQYINAIHELEIATNFKDFKEYDLNVALEFKEHLANKISKKTGKNISKSLYVHHLKYNKEFLTIYDKYAKKDCYNWFFGDATGSFFGALCRRAKCIDAF